MPHHVEQPYKHVACIHAHVCNLTLKFSLYAIFFNPLFKISNNEELQNISTERSLKTQQNCPN